MHLTRYSMYKNISKVFTQKKMSGAILGIDSIESFYSMINKKNSKITEVYYPEVDIHRLPFKDKTFDYVISDQVLEHVSDPFLAVAETYRVLKPGGIAVHASVFTTPVHKCPEDYWRYTPDGLRRLCKDFSEVLECGSWGNRIVQIIALLSDRLRFTPIPDRKFSLRNFIATWNEERYGITSWIVVRK